MAITERSNLRPIPDGSHTTQSIQSSNSWSEFWSEFESQSAFKTDPVMHLYSVASDTSVAVLHDSDSFSIVLELSVLQSESIVSASCRGRVDRTAHSKVHPREDAAAASLKARHAHLAVHVTLAFSVLVRRQDLFAELQRHNAFQQRLDKRSAEVHTGVLSEQSLAELLCPGP